MKAPGRNEAFTLLELLVAAVITLLLAGIMLSVTTGTLSIWRRTQDSFTSGSAAKRVLDMLERDLQSACFRKDGINNTWLAVDVTNTPGALVSHGWLIVPLMRPATTESRRLLPGPANGPTPTIADARFGLSGAWLRLFAATAESGSEPALPRAVAYQVARRPVTGAVVAANPAEVRYTLFRTFAGSQITFTSGYDLGSGYDGILQNPVSSDALATNVVDFGLWLYVRENSGALRRIYPADNDDLSHAATDAVAPADAGRFPAVADVMVRILTDEGARLLEAIENSTGTITRPAVYTSDGEWWWGVVEANSRVFVRRIEIKGGAW